MGSGIPPFTVSLDSAAAFLRLASLMAAASSWLAHIPLRTLRTQLVGFSGTEPCAKRRSAVATVAKTKELKKSPL